ncbi:hypothetical protein M5252_004540 [Vibrio parahaemolyticus]|nr:hypothetical protein [Vibrio parahaemolyticus]EJE8774988.1 hypothetical protein [Vibrio parahaemolyticus]
MMNIEERLPALQAQHLTDPKNIEVIHEICECYLALLRDEEVLPWTQRLLLIAPDDTTALTRQANALYLLGRYLESAHLWQRLQLRQGQSDILQLKLGMCLMMSGNITAAISLLSEVWESTKLNNNDTLSLASGFALGEAMLKNANPKGFPLWLLRNEIPELSPCYSPLNIPVWDGCSSLKGKRILVTHGLGFGDNFLLASCLGEWINQGAEIMLTCHPQIYDLMKTSLPNCEVVEAPSPKQFQSPLPNEIQVYVDRFSPHLHATLGHLPLIKSQSTLGPMRFFPPYIQAPNKKMRIARQWAHQLRSQYSNKNLVGVFWDCTQQHWIEVGAVIRCWAKRRSLPLDWLNVLVQDPKVESGTHFINLHHPIAGKLAGEPNGNISTYHPVIRDFSDTAACISQLDAVIAVDSSIANLSAMMGIPTCIPTHSSGDWRWGVEGDASPWISNVTVIRQTREGKWDDVVTRIQSWLIGIDNL